MSWEEVKELSSGASAGYWKVISFDCNVVTGYGHVKREAYLSKDAHADGKSPLEIRDVSFQLDSDAVAKILAVIEDLAKQV